MGITLITATLIPTGISASDNRLVLVENTSGTNAADLHVTFAGANGNINIDAATVEVLSDDIPECAQPIVPSNGQATSTAVIEWPDACINAISPTSGERVMFSASTTNGPLAFSGGFWTNSTGDNIRNVVGNSSPNTPAMPSGPTAGFKGVYYTYSTQACDPENEKVMYTFFWGHNDTLGKPAKTESNLVPSCHRESTNHLFPSSGNFEVRAMALEGLLSPKTVSVSSMASPLVSVAIDTPSCGSLRTDKNSYVGTETIEISFTNNCGKSIFLPSTEPWSAWLVISASDDTCALGFKHDLFQFAPFGFRALTEVPDNSMIKWMWDQKLANGQQIERGCYQIQIEQIFDENLSVIGGYFTQTFFTQGMLLTGETHSKLVARGTDGVILPLSTGDVIIEYLSGADAPSNAVVTTSTSGPSLPGGFEVSGSGVFYNVADTAGGIARLCASGMPGDQIFKDIDGDGKFEANENVTGNQFSDPFPQGFICTIFFQGGIKDPFFVVASPPVGGEDVVIILEE